jgi:hypothetical protein
MPNPVTAASGRLMVRANGFSLSLASCCGVGPPVSCAAALAATTEPVTIPSSARRRASLLLVKMRFKPSSAQSASLPDIRVLLPHRRLDALHRCPPITPRAASTRRPFWWQATPARRSLGTRQSSCSRTNSFRRVGRSRRRKLEARVGIAHRAGGGRRPDRRGLGAGTIGRRRDAQPRRRSASPGRAGRGRHRRPTAIIGTASANATGWRNRKFADSPLEGGIRTLGPPARVSSVCRAPASRQRTGTWTISP